MEECQDEKAEETGTANRNEGHDGSDEEFRLLARNLMECGCELAKFRPNYEVSASVRGLPAIMRELLRAEGALSPGELARRTGVTDARIANALRTLEERGFVERHASASDRRRVEVVVTEKGRQDALRYAREGESLVTGFLRELGEQDARDLVRVLRRVIEVMDARSREGRKVVPTPPAMAEEFIGKDRRSPVTKDRRSTVTKDQQPFIDKDIRSREGRREA